MRRRNDRGGERESRDVRANDGKSSCNEIQPHWIHGAVSGVERPSLLKFLGWIYKRKPAEDKKKCRYKARLVIKGYSQRQGLDYEETGPVVQFGSIRSILAVAATSRMQFVQFDVKTKFLHGDLNTEIFMAQPKGYEDGTTKVCKLQNAPYGLKQAARCWNKMFTNCLKEFNLRAISADSCVFTSLDDGETLILVIYIEDGLVASTIEKKIEKLLHHLTKAL